MNLLKQEKSTWDWTMLKDIQGFCQKKAGLKSRNKKQKDKEKKKKAAAEGWRRRKMKWDRMERGCNEMFFFR